MKEKKLPQNMIRIDDEDLADLVEEIVEFIPELRVRIGIDMGNYLPTSLHIMATSCSN